MATYTVVDKDKDPLDPGEVNAGTISVSDGDVFIIDPSVDTNVTFEDSSGAADFDIQINADNSNSFKLEVKSDLTPTVTVADNVDITNVDVDVQSAEGATLTVGDNVTMGKYDGSDSGDDTVTIGDGFTTGDNWTLGDGTNTMTVGDNATFEDLHGGKGDDTIIFGNGADIHDLDTSDGSDVIEFGDDLVAHNIKAGKGDDIIRIGENANVNSVDGQNGNDSLYTQTDPINGSNMEYTRVVCFAEGTRIETAAGPVEVERLTPGHLVRTADAGYRPVHWVGSTVIGLETLRRHPRLRPIRIAAGALGPGQPARDLVVSPQHRILMRSPIVQRMFGSAEIFVAAKRLTNLPGIDVLPSARPVAYYHLLLDRHAVVFAEGAASESLFLGEQAVEALDPGALMEIAALRRAPDRLARPCPKGRKLRKLLERHVANAKPLVTVRVNRPDDRRRRTAAAAPPRTVRRHQVSQKP